MKTRISRLRDSVLSGDPVEPDSPLEFLTVPARWLWVFFRTMGGHRAFLWAAGMSYTTLVALVPGLLLLFGILDALGLVEANQEVLTELIGRSFLGGLPEIEDIILPALLDVNLQAIGMVGIVGLLFVVSRLYQQVEMAFRVIFRSTRRRSVWEHLLFFYVAVTVAPLAVFLVASNAYQTLRGLGINLGINLLNLVFQFLTLTLIIKLLPTRKIRWGPTLLGAAVSTALIFVASWGFGWYVKLFDPQNPVRVIYGSLGVLPMFLAYIYLIWLAVLAGAETAAVSTDYKNLMRAELATALQQEGFTHVPQVDMAIAVTAMVAHHFDHGLGAVSSEQLAEYLGGEAIEPDHIARLLEQAGLLLETQVGWVPGRPLSELKQRDIAAAWHLATGNSDLEHPVADDIWEVMLVALEIPLPTFPVPSDESADKD